MARAVLAIDPGRVTGVAFFWDRELTAAQSVPRDPPRQWVNDLPLSGDISTICVEHPQIYRPRHSKGDPNDLTSLIRQCGFFELIASHVGAEYMQYLPQDWKRQLPKEVCRTRILHRLTDRERLLITDRLDHNAWDAIGIGLHHLGRGIV